MSRIAKFEAGANVRDVAKGFAQLPEGQVVRVLTNRNGDLRLISVANRVHEFFVRLAELLHIYNATGGVEQLKDSFTQIWNELAEEYKALEKEALEPNGGVTPKLVAFKRKEDALFAAVGPLFEAAIGKGEYVEFLVGLDIAQVQVKELMEKRALHLNELMLTKTGDSSLRDLWQNACAAVTDNA